MFPNEWPSDTKSTASAPKHAKSDYSWQFEQLKNEVNDELERDQGTPPSEPTLSPDFTFSDLETEAPPVTPSTTTPSSSQTHEEHAQQVGQLIPHLSYCQYLLQCPLD